MRSSNFNNKIKLLGASAVAVIASLAGCEGQAPDKGELFNRFGTVTTGDPALVGALGVGPGGNVLTNAQVEQEVIAVIASARVRLQVAFEDLESQAVAQSLIDAQRRGVDVRVVGDVDRREQSGFRLLTDPGAGLKDNGDGLPPVVFGDGALSYSPAPTTEVARSGDQNLMTHNFVIADDVRVYNLTGGFIDEGRPVAQIGFDAISEDIAKDFGDEFNQMYGGMFATTLSAFNGPLKTNTNSRTHYPNDIGDLEVFFGPQERLMKRLIDDIYGARASVFVVTESFTNTFVADALRYKAENGFKVGVVVNRENRDVPFSRVDNIRTLFDGIREGQGDDTLPDLRLTSGVHLNMVIIDAEPSPINKARYKTRVYVLSEPILESISFNNNGDGTEARPADAFSDANMWTLTRTAVAPEPNVDRFINLFEFLFNQGE